MDAKTLAVDTLITAGEFFDHAGFSPDGKQILFAAPAEAFGGIGRDKDAGPYSSMYDVQLFLYDIASHTPTPLTKDFNPSVQNVVWSKADGQIYISAEDRDYVNLFVLNPATGSIGKLPISGDYAYRFDKASQRLQAAFPHKILRHMDNSAGIEHFPERQLDMCRLGIGLYGVDSIDNRILNTVSTLKTTILQMRHVPKEETVGYSRKGVLTRDSVIAAIPIGYADGLNRHLGRGRCYCLVNGKKAPYVGNICMDVAMIDVTDIDCKEGDTVEIFGSHLPVTVLSDCLDTIPYEVLTGVSNRVKRVYVQE